MRRLLWHWILSTIVLVLAVQVVPGVKLTSLWNAIWIAPLLGLVNMAVGMVAGLASFVFGCVNVLTLGLFGFLLSFGLYTFAVYYLGHPPEGPLSAYLPVESWVSAMILAVVMALFGALLNMVPPRRK